VGASLVLRHVEMAGAQPAGAAAGKRAAVAAAGNAPPDAELQGAAYVKSGALIAEHSTFRDFYGALASHGATHGGALAVESGTRLAATACTFANNRGAARRASGAEEFEVAGRDITAVGTRVVEVVACNFTQVSHGAVRPLSCLLSCLFCLENH
jgi:hypothetical protein